MSGTTEQWHMKKEVNIAHVITTVALLVSVLFFFADLDKRIEGNTKDISFVKEQRKEDQNRLEKRLDSMDKKLDKILEVK